jgi:hypothetical protein
MEERERSRDDDERGLCTVGVTDGGCEPQIQEGMRR